MNTNAAYKEFPDSPQFGKQVKTYREERGMSRAELASALIERTDKKISVTKGDISNYERGRDIPRGEHGEAIYQALEKVLLTENSNINPEEMDERKASFRSAYEKARAILESGNIKPNDPDRISFGNLLGEYSGKNGIGLNLTGDELAKRVQEKLGVHGMDGMPTAEKQALNEDGPVFIWEIEQGKRSVSKELAGVITETLGMPVAERQATPVMVPPLSIIEKEEAPPVITPSRNGKAVNGFYPKEAKGDKEPSQAAAPILVNRIKGDLAKATESTAARKPKDFVRSADKSEVQILQEQIMSLFTDREGNEHTSDKIAELSGGKISKTDITTRLQKPSTPMPEGVLQTFGAGLERALKRSEEEKGDASSEAKIDAKSIRLWKMLRKLNEVIGKDRPGMSGR